MLLHRSQGRSGGSSELYIWPCLYRLPVYQPITLLQLSGTILFAVVIALLAAWLLSRRIAQPVEAIARASLAVSAGDLTRRVPVESSIRELESLGQSFNT